MNKAFQGAFAKGERAALSEQPRKNPYIDKRKDDGRLTFSRAFRTAWFDGYDSAMKEMDENPKVRKWKRVGLSVVTGKERREMVATMLENQSRMLEKNSSDDESISMTDVIKKVLRGIK